MVQFVLIGVGALWPLIAFAGGLGYSPLVAVAAILCLPFTLLRLRPQVYMIGIIAFLGFAGASIMWSPREIRPFDFDFHAMKFAIRYDVYRLGLTRTKELALTGRSLSGVEAADCGLINAAVPFARLEEEVAAQAERLLALGCFEAQGFHFGKPVPAEQFKHRWLQPAAVDHAEATAA